MSLRTAGWLGLLLLAACTPSEEVDVPEVDVQVDLQVERAIPAPEQIGSERVLPTLLGAQLQPVSGDLEAMKARGILRVLVGYSHTHYFMDGLHLRGISAENLRQFEPFLHKALGDPKPRINVLPFPVARDQMIDLLAQGYADIAIGNITVTDERAAQVEFSTPLRRDVAEVIVHGTDVAPIADLDGLSGRAVYVRASSSFHNSLEDMNQGLTARGLNPIQIRTLDEYLQTEDVLELVNAGAIAITVADDHMAEFWSGVLPNIVMRTDLPIRTGREIAWAIRPGLTGMKEIVDEFVRGHREGTLVGNVLFQRYLENNRYVHDASASADRQRFQDVIELFQRYSDEYDFDWLLIAAQGYQESRLIQSKRSPAGAVGVMQLLPGTAIAPPVEIRNIEELEANVHAGHKYLRHIADRYFDDPRISELDRHLLSFAAYNAGPTRISRLRRQAPSEGVNPDVWFGEMERLVAREVGMEPVTYVRNIFKYYVTYKLMQEGDADHESDSVSGG